MTNQTGEELSRNPQMQLGGLLGEWPEQPEMQWVEEASGVRVDGARVTIDCRTNLGERCSVVLTACTESVLRLTLVPAGLPLDPPLPNLPTQILVDRKWPAVPVRVEEGAEQIVVSIGRAPSGDVPGRTTVAGSPSDSTRPSGSAGEAGGSGLRVVIQKLPWELRVVDSGGRLVVGEHRADTNMRGWRRTKWLGYARDASGRVSRTYEAFRLGAQEHVFGLGEKFMPLDKRGRRIDGWNWNTWGATNERAYKNVPFYLSTNGYGCFVHTTRRVQWDFGSGQESSISSSFETEDPYLDVFLIHGPGFPAILERYTALTGRAPVPPRWSFGFWMSYYGYRSWEEVDEVANGLREHEIPADVIHLDPYWQREGMYADLVWDEARFPEPAKHLAALRERGIRICLWVQPWIPTGSEVYAEGAAHGYFARTKDGAVYHYVPTIPGNPPAQCGIVDFTNLAARRWYKDRLVGLIKQGVAAFKTDFGEAISEDAVFANGMTGRELHDVYPLVYNSCFYEAFAEAGAEPVCWGRSGCAGIQRYPVSWSGDQPCNFPAMVCTIWSGLSFGLSGAAFWSHDVGGFSGVPDPELYIRWAQWGLLSSHTRSHGTTRREPWRFGEDAVRIFREYARLRYRLIPYLYSCAHEAAATGLPVMRALVLVDQSDPNAWIADAEYLLGPDLLVCPVTEAGVASQWVYLPRGAWIDYWSGEMKTGGQWLDAPVTLARIPLFVRVGAILPLGPEEQWVGEQAGGELTLLVYPDANGEAAATIRHDGGQTELTYRDGTLTVRGVPPEYKLAARLARTSERIEVSG